MSDVYPVILRVGRATSSHTHHQNHFLISGVFGPPALWNPIDEFIQQLVLLVMYGYLCNLIRVDHASCWSHLKTRFITFMFPSDRRDIKTNSIMYKEKLKIPQANEENRESLLDGIQMLLHPH
ncbi:hypothetical protein OROGR_016262 [Orobanche gracilis]